MSHKEKIKQLREDFAKDHLHEEDLKATPADQFDFWMSNAVAAQVPEAQAMVLSTVSSEAKPSSRVVYLREYEHDQFWFYGNYNSRKAEELLKNPNVCLNFFWPVLERQVRIEGVVAKADPKKSDEYFSHRPHDSKIGAWSSPQSQMLNDRAQLEKWVNENTIKYKGKDIERPGFWGGFVVTASYYEFWQGRKSRLHDRICFTLQNNSWQKARLAP